MNAAAIEEPVTADEESVAMLAHNSRKRCIDLIAGAGVENVDLQSQDLGGGLLLSWPPGLNNYLLQQNPDLNTTNWMTLTNGATLLPELTGMSDPALPMGTNWAFFAYTNARMFFRLQPAP